MEPRFVYITAQDTAQALTLGRALVEARLAACANVLPGMTSIYWWQGAVEQAQEAVLVVKSRAELLPELVAEVKRRHTYQVPCVVALPILAGNPEYLRWLLAETRAPRSEPVSP